MEQFKELHQEIQPSLSQVKLNSSKSILHVYSLEKVGTQNKLKAGRKRSLSTFEQLFLLLLWMRQYPTEYLIAFIFNISQSSVNYYIHTTFQILYNHMNPWLYFPNRAQRDKNSVWWRGILIAVVVDGAEQAILRPGEKFLEQLCFSGKKCRHTLTQLVICSPEGKIRNFLKNFRSYLLY